MLSLTSRALYDKAFIEAGCPEELFDPTTVLDNTFGTYATNFLIAIAAFIAYTKLFEVSNIHSPRKLENLLPNFFLATAISMFIAGVGHFVVASTDDQPKKDVFEKTSYLFNGFSSMYLAFYGMVWFGIKPTTHKILWRLVLAAFVIATVYFALFHQSGMKYIGIIGIVSYLFVTISQVYSGLKLDTTEEKATHFMKAIGSFLLLVGFVVQLILAPTCGDSGYKNCYDGCPLPNPLVFNHNGLFHVVFFVGVVVLAYGEYSSASVVDYGSHAFDGEYIPV